MSINVLRPGGTNVHLYPSPFRHESRIDRICDALEELQLFDRILTVGVCGERLEPSDRVTAIREHRRIARTGEFLPGVARKVVQTCSWMINTFGSLRREPITCVNCHSLPVLPLAVALKRYHGAKLVYDTHELETETASARGISRVPLKCVERVLIQAVDEVSVVSASIADWYRSAYGLERVHVIRNVPDRQVPMEPSIEVLRTKLGIPPGDLIFLYPGVLSHGRRIEQFLRVFAAVPLNRHLVFMGTGPLESIVREAAAARRNVHFLPAVPARHVLAHTAGADVGLCGVENVCLSYYFSLPNKLFEFLAAGVPVLVPEFPEMKQVVEQYYCGWVVADSDEDWARAVVSLDRASIMTARARCAELRTLFTWEREKTALHDLYAGLFADAWAPSVPAHSHE